MAWITLTEADVLTVLSGPELEGYRAAALKEGQDDPVQPCIDDVTERIRGEVEGCASNVLGPVGTIPSRLKTAALDILAVRIPGRVGKAPKPGRETALKAATDLLARVAKCDFSIGETPVPTTEQSSSAPTPSFSGRTRRSASSRDGL